MTDFRLPLLKTVTTTNTTAPTTNRLKTRLLLTGDVFLSGPFRTGSRLGSFLVSMKFIVGLELPTSQRARASLPAHVRARSACWRGTDHVGLWGPAGGFRMNRNRTRKLSPVRHLRRSIRSMGSSAARDRGGFRGRQIPTFSATAGGKGSSGGRYRLRPDIPILRSLTPWRFSGPPIFRRRTALRRRVVTGEWRPTVNRNDSDSLS